MNNNSVTLVPGNLYRLVSVSIFSSGAEPKTIEHRLAAGTTLLFLGVDPPEALTDKGSAYMCSGWFRLLFLSSTGNQVWKYVFDSPKRVMTVYYSDLEPIL
jgi:hypothetical protein